MWVKLSDNTFSDLLIDVSSGAKLLYVVGMAECAKKLTDGNLSPARFRVAVALAGVQDSTVDELVAEGLWIDVGGGAYKIVRYLDDQPSAEEVEKDKRQNADRQKNFRDRQRLLAQADRAAEAVAANKRRAGAASTVTNGVSSSVSNGVSNGVTAEATQEQPPKRATAPQEAPRPMVGLAPLPDGQPALVILPATPAAPKPHKPVAPRTGNGKTKEWSDLWDALATGIGTEPQTKTEKTLHAAKTNELYEMTPRPAPSKVLEVCNTYRTLHPTWECTVTAILKWWSACANPQAARAVTRGDGTALREGALRMLEETRPRFTEASYKVVSSGQ